jgi:hypothetical protein
MLETWVWKLKTEDAFMVIAICLFAATILQMVSIVRDALPKMSEQDQRLLRGWFGSIPSRKSEKALKNAWNLHISVFPKSHKRIIFASLLTAASLSLTDYPLWLALGPR